jgi:hypothetical protein
MGIFSCMHHLYLGCAICAFIEFFLLKKKGNNNSIAKHYDDKNEMFYDLFSKR